MPSVFTAEIWIQCGATVKGTKRLLISTRWDYVDRQASNHGDSSERFQATVGVIVTCTCSWFSACCGQQLHCTADIAGARQISGCTCTIISLTCTINAKLVCVRGFTHGLPCLHCMHLVFFCIIVQRFNVTISLHGARAFWLVGDLVPWALCLRKKNSIFKGNLESR